SILSNIFTSITEPELMDDRTFYKIWSAVGVSSAKVPPISYFQDMLENRMTNAVIEFLLRPDPDVTEKVLAKEFFAEHLSTAEDSLALKASLGTDTCYSRYLSRPFLDEFRLSRSECINKLKLWVEGVLSANIDLENPLDIEKGVVASVKATQEK